MPLGAIDWRVRSVREQLTTMLTTLTGEVQRLSQTS